MPAQTDKEFILQSWHWLLDNEPYIAYRMLSTRQIFEHRGILPGDVALYLGRSREWAYQAIRPWAMRLPGDPWRHNSMSVKVALQRLDDLDTGITRLTDLQGGVYDVCRCSIQSVEELKIQLSSAQVSKYVKEMFPDAQRD